MTMTEEHKFGIDQDDEGVTPNPPVDDGTVLADLRAALTSPEEGEERLEAFTVPRRSNMEVVYAVDIEYDLLKLWSRKSTDRKKKDFDQLRFSYAVLAATNRGFRMGGRDVKGEDGEPLTFHHPEFRQMVKAANTQEAIKHLYGSDGHVIATSQKVLEAAGYNDDDVEEAGGPLGQG